MIIILSPSKTQNEDFSQAYQSDIPLLDQKATLSLFKRLKHIQPEAMSEAMGIKGKLLHETVKLYQSFDPKHSPQCAAIDLYTGIAFEQLRVSEYDENQKAYLSDHVRILSAMYGLLHPSCAVWPYRLDFTMKLPDLNLRTAWSTRIQKALKDEPLIIDLSSHEFSSLLTPLKDKIHHVVFLDNIDGHEKIISANAKKARGKMAHFLIQNRICNVSDMSAFCEDGYQFQSARSSEKISVFVKVSR